MNYNDINPITSCDTCINRNICKYIDDFTEIKQGCLELANKYGEHTFLNMTVKCQYYQTSMNSKKES